MAKTFLAFIQSKLTVSVLITVAVFNIFNPIVDDVIAPMILYLVDPEDKLSDQEVVLNEKRRVKYGSAISFSIVSLFVFFMIYYGDRFIESSKK